MKKNLIKILLASCVIITASCGGDDEVEPTGGIVDMSENTNANKVSTDESITRWEMPKLQNDFDYITHYLSDGRLNYAIEYCPQKYHAHWVAYRYDTSLAAQRTTRSDEWGAEPYYNNNRKYQIAAGEMFSGYNRGHIIGSAERLCSREANVQTFYMSNMSPMLSKFNSVYWGEVEDKVRDNWGRKVAAGDTLYVVKGGTIDDNHIRQWRVNVRNTLGQTVEVVVPTHYFIACLMRRANGNCTAIGFYMEHKDYKDESTTFLSQLRRNSAMSIDELEKLTGIDFFCNVPDRIENFVESRYDISSWQGL